MVRRRWPDAVIVLGVAAIAATGVWALWGDALMAWWQPSIGSPPVETAPPAAGTT
jgi:hypothetical protein